MYCHASVYMPLVNNRQLFMPAVTHWRNVISVSHMFYGMSSHWTNGHRTPNSWFMPDCTGHVWNVLYHLANKVVILLLMISHAVCVLAYTCAVGTKVRWALEAEHMHDGDIPSGVKLPVPSNRVWRSHLQWAAIVSTKLSVIPSPVLADTLKNLAIRNMMNYD